MRVVIAAVQMSFVRGRAKIFGGAVVLGPLRSKGHKAEGVAMPFRWRPAESILDGILACCPSDVTARRA
jgi:hypothetical protein